MKKSLFYQITVKNESNLFYDMELFKSDNLESIKDIIKNARKNMRFLLDNHIADINHDDEKKFEEIEFFSNVLRHMTRKWYLEILWELTTNKGLKFNDLKRHLKTISSRTLSDSLKFLQDLGLINRIMQDTRPPTVFYELSDKGNGLIELALYLIYFLMESDFKSQKIKE
ncbi:MAG: winged helix-turn-helix transcriptional regulator [Candidatus Helarchaeota archaeon]